MSGTVNKAIIIGNCGNDPELRYFPSGTAFCNLSLATSKKFKDKESGQWQERTEWHNIALIGKPAEIVAQYAKKGSKLYVEGELRTRSWEKDGIKHYKTEIMVDQFDGSFQFLGSEAAAATEPQRTSGLGIIPPEATKALQPAATPPPPSNQPQGVIEPKADPSKQTNQEWLDDLNSDEVPF